MSCTLYHSTASHRHAVLHFASLFVFAVSSLFSLVHLVFLPFLVGNFLGSLQGERRPLDEGKSGQQDDDLLYLSFLGCNLIDLSGQNLSAVPGFLQMKNAHR